MQSKYEKVNPDLTPEEVAMKKDLMKEVGMLKDLLNYTLNMYKTVRRENILKDPNYERDNMMKDVDD